MSACAGRRAGLLQRQSTSSLCSRAPGDPPSHLHCTCRRFNFAANQGSSCKAPPHAGSLARLHLMTPRWQWVPRASSRAFSHFRYVHLDCFCRAGQNAHHQTPPLSTQEGLQAATPQCSPSPSSTGSSPGGGGLGAAHWLEAKLWRTSNGPARTYLLTAYVLKPAAPPAFHTMHLCLVCMARCAELMLVQQVHTQGLTRVDALLHQIIP